ncbi:MAG TPA: ATP-binding cassette domain-containing protein, partial [Fimbriimonadaceae bacterium]|nr:ATP-binding cassette domain-containing protein [Fimbriimonadaceae bacterium]
VGAGRTETMRAIFGADPIDSGSISIGGRLQRLQSWSVARAVAVGLAYLPEDRKTLGLFLDRSVEDNVASANLPRCSRGAMVDGSKTHDLATRSVRQLAIKVRDVEQEVSSLSGGNQQKVLLARWLATNPKVLIVDEPTRGVDIGAKSEIHRMLREYASQGNGVIVVSSEMPELLGLCDRILVMREGRIAGEASGSEMTEERLIEFAMGNASA